MDSSIPNRVGPRRASHALFPRGPTGKSPLYFSVLLRLPLPLSSRTCWCDRPLDSPGHHRASCPRAGVLGRRGCALESAAARIYREAGARTAHILNSQATKSHLVGDSRRRDRRFPSHTRQQLGSRSRARQSWMHKWGSTLACAAARAFASSLLYRQGHPGADGDTQAVLDVSGDFCRAPLHGGLRSGGLPLLMGWFPN